MKKKLVLFLIVFVSFCNLAFVNAAEGGTVTIRQNGTAGTQGSYNGQICKKDVIVNEKTVRYGSTRDTTDRKTALNDCQSIIPTLADNNGTEKCVITNVENGYRWLCDTSKYSVYKLYGDCKNSCSGKCSFKKKYNSFVNSENL